MAIQDPTNANCAACHGEVHPATDEPLTISAQISTIRKPPPPARWIASQRINASGVNLAGSECAKPGISMQSASCNAPIATTP